MSDIRPKRKIITYDLLAAEIDYIERLMTLTNQQTGETITIPHDAYAELQAILADIGRLVPITPTTTGRKYN